MTNFIRSLNALDVGRSPPMRGRGSKRLVPAFEAWRKRRPPCGGVDRNSDGCVTRATRAVAPHAGAWIETRMMNSAGVIPPVAPHAGAWIETIGYGKVLTDMDVAPHAGAWIETCAAP